MSSHNGEQNASSLFGDSGPDDPFSQLQQQDQPSNSHHQQQPAKVEQPQTAIADEHSQHSAAGQLKGEQGEAASMFGNDNSQSADMLFGAPSNGHDVFNTLGQSSAARQQNASAAAFFDQAQVSDSFFDNINGSSTAADTSQTGIYTQQQPPQEQTQQPMNAMSSLTQAYDPNTYGYDYSQQNAQQPQQFDQQYQQQQQQQQQQYDPSQWIQFDPNVHYFYDEQGQVQYYDPNTNQVYDMSQYGFDQQQDYQYDPQYADYYAQQQQQPGDSNAYVDQQQQQQQQQQYDPNAYATTQQQQAYDYNAYASHQQQGEAQTQYQHYDPNAYTHEQQQVQEQEYDAHAPMEQQQEGSSFEDLTKQAEQTGFNLGTDEQPQQQQLFSQFTNDNDEGEQEVPLYVPSNNDQANSHDADASVQEQPVSLAAVPEPLTANKQQDNGEEQQVTLSAVSASLQTPAQQYQLQKDEQPITLSAVPVSVPPPQQQPGQSQEEELVTLSALPSSPPPPPSSAQQQQTSQQQSPAPEQPKQQEPATATSPTASYYGYTPLERSSTMNSSHTYSEMDHRRFSASPFSVAGGSAANASVTGNATGGYPYPMERSATVPPPMMDRMSSPRPTLVPCPDPNCEGENKPKAKFCCECGRPLAGISRSTTPSVAAVAGAAMTGVSPNNVFGMESINPISLGQVADTVRKSALEDKKDMFKESLKKFSEHSVIVQSELDVEEKRRRALEYMVNRIDKSEDETKILLWRVVKLMIEHSDCTLGDGGALDKAIVAEILPQKETEQKQKVEVDSGVAKGPVAEKSEKNEITKDLTVVEETAVVLKDIQEDKDAESPEEGEKRTEGEDEIAEEDGLDKDSALNIDATTQTDIPEKDALETESSKETEYSTDVIDELEKLLLQGDREVACSYASKKNMWAHAFSIASSNSDLLRTTVTRFINQELYDNSTESINYFTFEHKQLRMLYSVFAGKSTDAVAAFVKQKEADMAEYSLETLEGWKRALALILANRSNNDQIVISSLGDQLQQAGAKENDARLCYFLSPDVSALDNRKMVGENLYADLDSLYLAELYEFATKANVRQDFKFILAWWLSESGMKDEAQKYCDSILNHLGTAADAESLLKSLKQLGNIENVLIDSQNATAFLNKETFEFLISNIENGYNNNQNTANNTYSSQYGYEAQTTDYGQSYDYSGQAVNQQVNTSQHDSYSYGYDYSEGYTAPMNEAGTPFDNTAAVGAPPVSKAINSPFQSTTQAQAITSPLQKSNVKPVSSPFGMQQQPQHAVRSPFMQQQPSQQQTPAPSYQPYQTEYSADQNQQQDSGGGAWWNSEASQENVEDLQAGNNTVSATTNMYEPSNHMSYQPDAYTPAATTANTQQSTGGSRGFDDDDDLGFGNNSTKKVSAEKAGDKGADKDTAKEEHDKKAADSKKEKEQKEKSSWGLFSLFGGGKKEKEASDEKKPVKANLGEQSTFYYDEKEKRWVNKLNDSKPAAASLPPPPKASTPQPPTAPSMAPPPSIAKPNSMPPSRSHSALNGPPGAAGGPPGAVPPPSFSTPSAGRKAGGARKPMRSRYVDVLNPPN